MVYAIDSHAHLHFEEFDLDREKVINRAKKAGVIAIINVSISLQDFYKSLQLVKQYPGYLFPTLGFAPQLLDIDNLDDLVDYANNNASNYVAIGECGLDYYWITEDKEIKLMRDSFEEILNLVSKLDKPLIIHARTAHRRNAYQDIVKLLVKYNIKHAVFHSFLGNKQDLKKIVEGGWYIGLSTVFLRRKDLDFILKIAPLDRILLETDSPYLAPIKGSRNEPQNVVRLLEFLVKTLSMSPSELSIQFISNTIQFFRLPMKIPDTDLVVR